MDEEFKKQIKEQIKKVSQDIYAKVGESKRLKTAIERLRNERSAMNKMLSGKPGRKKGKKDGEPANV